MKTISDIQDMIDELQESADKLESNYIDYIRSGDKILANMEYQTLTFRWGQISMLEWVIEDELKVMGNKEDKQ